MISMRITGLDTAKIVTTALMEIPKTDTLMDKVTGVTYENVRDVTPRVGMGKSWSLENILYNSIHRFTINPTRGVIFSDNDHAEVVERGSHNIQAISKKTLKHPTKGSSRSVMNIFITRQNRGRVPVVFPETVKGQTGARMFERGLLESGPEIEKILDEYITQKLKGGR